MKAAKSDGGEFIEDKAFDADAVSVVTRNSRGPGWNKYEDVWGDHHVVPNMGTKTSINVASNDIKSLRLTWGASSVRYLNVHSNDVGSCELRGTRELEVLIVTDNKLTNIAQKAGSTEAHALIKLDASGNDIVSLWPAYMRKHSPEPQYKSLKFLTAVNNDIESIEGLSLHCPELECLDLRNNNLGKGSSGVMREIAGITAIRSVCLAGNNLKDVEDFVHFAENVNTGLRHLNVKSNDLPKSALRRVRSILVKRGCKAVVIDDFQDETPVGPVAVAVQMERRYSH